ncbi:MULTISPECIES: capsule polysaccharide export inner-membrane protein [Acetobacteraceae]|uniref:Capsule polysaccharide export inner-membrane protein n=2 Tax=Gluconobacter oxydans TaxID=442 RepID=Q5FQW9_GLUOX|nr:capsule polysaccharide export inner-membrane protein [Gluconobacter oxydans]AAW61227.1 Capsule polysaccharide export inner-membrane protein [Gluconobacter oxydans 621H]KXV35399.1 hypothetical protein AD939_01730 [Gluconobacter oxydans]KXV66355.1 hypothetical protein AD950_01975 [Gluconobacter oxydans]MBF0857006.1 hypothetical protein [Gluconobacter oxydans]TCW23663.1 capsular polysaccharide transport system permease protein [Gluconobacter oxydans]
MNSVKKLFSDYLFLGFVVVPTLLSVLYFGFLASDVYISESRFVVRSPEKPSASGLGVMFKSAGIANSSDEEYAADDYIISRDALRSIDTDHSFVRAYTDPHISILNRYNPIKLSSSFEDMYLYFKRKVKVDNNSTTGITTLTVRAYQPENAQKFNEELLKMAEDTVNHLNERARADLIEFAKREVRDAEQEAQKAAVAIAEYRNNHRIINPEQQASGQLQMLSKFEDALISARAQLAMMQKTAADNPGIAVLKNRIMSISKEMANEVTRISGADTSLASQASEYQGLILADQIAAKQLTAAVSSLEQAEMEARRQQSYVERIAQPSLPDAAGEPHRLRDIFATFLMGIILWNIARMLNASIREHMD